MNFYVFGHHFIIINNNIEKITDINKFNDIISNLDYLGFIVKEDINESLVVEFHKRKAEFNSTILKLTIEPTLSCNMHCSYCFEDKTITQNDMHNDVINGIYEFVKSKIKNISKLKFRYNPQYVSRS